MSKERFFAHLQSHFAPRLRESGFTGSGQNFRRQVNDVLHAINIQGNRYGGSCTVNLGVHPVFLTCPGPPRMPDPKTHEEIDCEFRIRLVKESGDWWTYQSEADSPESQADDLIATYFRDGEAYFRRFSRSEDILSYLTPERLGSEYSRDNVLGKPPHARSALVAARMHAHFGHDSLRRECAEFGLAHLGRAGALRDELEALSR